MPLKECLLLPGLGGDETTMMPVERRLVRAFPEILTSTLVGELPLSSQGEMKKGWFRYPKDSQRDLEHTRREPLEHLDESIMKIHRFLNRRIETGVEPSELGVIGHSQGGAVALAAGLTFPQPLGFVCSIAGYLVLPPAAKPRPTPTRYFLLHGSQDDVVNVRWSYYAEQWMARRGFHVELEIGDFEVFPHGMHARQIAAIVKRLRAV